jgi:cobalt-zinc-cadmium efflux system outer membrane protein
VQRRYKAGDLARLDANLAQGELLAAEAERLDAEQALRQTELSYRKLMGTDAPQLLPPEAPRTNEDGVTHPLLQALRTQAALDASRLAVLDASRRDAPELALRWSSQRSDAAEPYARAVGVKLTVPLSSEARVQRDGAAARAELAQSEAELAQSLTRIDEGVALARSERDKSERQWVMAQQRAVLVADNRRLAQKSFDLGESDLPALMRARAADDEAQSWLKRQELARHAAQSRLHQAQGILP